MALEERKITGQNVILKVSTGLVFQRSFGNGLGNVKHPIENNSFML